MTLLGVVDKNDPYELFNIKHLPKLKFKDNVLNLILEENISKYLKGLFYFNLYVNEEEIIDESLTLDEDGNLRTTFPMDIKNTYRVGIHLCDNISSISNSERYKITSFINREIIDNRRLESLIWIEPKISIFNNK